MREHVPLTGVYTGELIEDFATTVQRLKKSYAKVKIEEIFGSSDEYPYTYVPVWCQVLPLREGDKVLVTFDQANPLYPVLYRNPSEIPEEMRDKFGPDNESPVMASSLGDGGYILSSDSYTTIIHHSVGLIFGKKGATGINFFELRNGTVSIGNLLKDICEYLKTIASWTTSVIGVTVDGKMVKGTGTFPSGPSFITQVTTTTEKELTDHWGASAL